MLVTILSGSGRYQDAWHDFTATSQKLAQALEPLGLEVAVHPLTPQGVLAGVGGADLVVVNAGRGESGPDDPPPDGPTGTAWGEAFESLREHRSQRRPVLALHAAANTLEGWPEWPQWIGGRWDRERSMHPPLGPARVEVSDGDHPVTAGLDAFTLIDERYCHLEVFAGSRVLLHHEHDGAQHPLVWTTETAGARTVYDALGHDLRSFDSASRVDLLRREVRWLLGLGGGST